MENKLRKEIKKVIHEVTKDYRLQHKSGEYYETDIFTDELSFKLETLINKRDEEVINKHMMGLMTFVASEVEDIEVGDKVVDVTAIVFEVGKAYNNYLKTNTDKEGE